LNSEGENIRVHVHHNRRSCSWNIRIQPHSSEGELPFSDHVLCVVIVWFRMYRSNYTVTIQLYAALISTTEAQHIEGNDTRFFYR
jgi:hypothetical protein